MPNFIVVLEKWQFDKSRKINENESELLNFVCFAISTVHLWVETAHMSMTHLANYALGSPLHDVTYVQEMLPLCSRFLLNGHNMQFTSTAIAK